MEMCGLEKAVRLGKPLRAKLERPQLWSFGTCLTQSW